MIFFRRFKFNFSKGFTLIETIIAIFILSVGILGSYMIFYNLYSQSGGLSYKLTASYLAQEGIEIIRNMRDNNWVLNRNWLTGIVGANDNCNYGCPFQADYKTGTASTATGLSPYPTNGDDGTPGNFLNLDSNGMYSYDPNYTPTIFKRKITITVFSDGGSGDIFGSSDIFKVDSTVTWEYKGKQFFVKIVDFLYNWY